MSIDVTSTAMSVAAAPTATKVNSNGVGEKSSSDTSFKDEMTKVSDKKDTKTDAKKAETKKTDKTETKCLKKESKQESKDIKQEKDSQIEMVNNSEQVLNGIVACNNFDEAFTNANNLLQSDIAQMIENTCSVNPLQGAAWSFGFGDEACSNNLKFTQSDAQFFINLTNSGDVSSRNMFSQALNMLNSGANTKEVAQNFKVSQALLNALNEARQNNQPLRVDFDQNISVILRIGKDGALAAQFIPGDKAVEQYLRSNIESLKSSFDEKELPYTELSYSNSSKQQNRRRREQQGE